MHEHLLQTAHDPPQHRHFVLFYPLLRPQRLGVAVHVVAQEGKLGTLSQLPPMLLPKPHLVAQQIFVQPQVLQLPQELIQRVMLIVEPTEMLQRIPQRNVGRARAAVQGNQGES